jgi:hypothetical protein
VYVHLAHQPLKVDMPTFYGIFECGIGLALIISDEGEPLIRIRPDIGRILSA